MSTALLIGGTGPTGPGIAKGLLERGFNTKLLHRGTHEEPTLPQEIEHIHADPFDEVSFGAAIAGMHFDLVVSTYGRLRMISEVLAGKVDRIVAIGGAPVYKGWFVPSVNFPPGFEVPLRECSPRAETTEDGDHSFRTARAENEFLARVHAGDFGGTILRYPYIYGPRQIQPREWSIIRRIQDGRRVFVLPEGGSSLNAHGYSGNIVHSVMLAVDNAAVANGRGFNCADEICLSRAQWIHVVAKAMGVEVEILASPSVAGHPSMAIMGHRSSDHRVLDISDAKQLLGYRDLTPPPEALASVVQWYCDNPVERGGELERSLQDPFDYALEDKFVALSRAHQADLSRLCGADSVIEYSYSSRPKAVT